MGYSVSVSRLSTLTLVGPPLGFLPYHRDDRFPRSTHEPDSGSRYLYAGRRPDSMQVSPGLILVSRKLPVLTSSNFISTPHQSFACARLPEPHLTPFTVPFPPGRPVEFHHQSPTDPYVSLSTHTARASLPPEAFQSQAYLARKSSSRFPG